MRPEYRGVEQLVARRAHNPEVVGSSPASATMLCNQKRYCTGKPRSHNGFWVFSCPDFQVQTKRYFSLLRGLELPTPALFGGFREIFLPEDAFFRFQRKIIFHGSQIIRTAFPCPTKRGLPQNVGQTSSIQIVMIFG
jgi:hypothetical protein